MSFKATSQWSCIAGVINFWIASSFQAYSSRNQVMPFSSFYEEIIQNPHGSVYVSWERDADTTTVVRKEFRTTAHAAYLSPLTKTLYLAPNTSFPMYNRWPLYTLYLISCDSNIAQPEMRNSRYMVTLYPMVNHFFSTRAQLNPRSCLSKVSISLLQIVWLCYKISRVHIVFLPAAPTLNCTLHLFPTLTPRHYKVCSLYGSTSCYAVWTFSLLLQVQLKLSAFYVI